MATATTGCLNKENCDNCRETGVLKDAVSFCSECDLHFCVACGKLHGKFAPGHTTDLKENVDSVGERTTNMSCSIHSKETIEYYCQAHESAICKICKESEHDSCAVQNIADACEGTNISKGIYDTVKELIKLQQNTDKLKCEEQIILQTCQSDIHSYRYDIKTLRKEFNIMFDRYDSQLESQEISVVNNLSYSVHSCARLSDQVTELTKSLEERQDGLNNQMLFLQLINAKNTCTELRSAFEEIQRKRVRYDIGINQDKNHQTLLDQISKLVYKVADSEEDNYSEVEKTDTNGQMKTKSFLNIKSCSLVKATDVRARNDKYVPLITGCCQLLDGQIILCDYSSNDKLKILDKDFNIKFTAPCPPGPWDVDCIDESSAVVTVPEAKALHFISVKPGFKFQQKIDLNLKCKGVTVHDKNIFVCIDESEPSKSGVKVLNLSGDDVSFISHLGPGSPRNLCVTADGTMIYYTGRSGNDPFINCVTQDGYGILSISSSKLSFPTGILNDQLNNIMICDDHKRCIQVFNSEGLFGKVLLEQTDDLYPPKSMCLNKNYDSFVVASYKSSEPRASKLICYKLEYC